MQLQMSFLETPATTDAAQVWTTLDAEQRAEVMAVLGRLIAVVAAQTNQKHPNDTKEKDDE